MKCEFNIKKSGFTNMRYLHQVCFLVVVYSFIILHQASSDGDQDKEISGGQYISSGSNITINNITEPLPIPSPTPVPKPPDPTQDFVHKIAPNASVMDKKPPRSKHTKNYAAFECAKVLEANPEAKKAIHIISDHVDEYMLNPCKAQIWFVIELCDAIQATHIEIANYELFSSTPKEFTVYFSDTFPASDWKVVGKFTATDSRELQAFDLNQVGFGKFVRVEMHSHYGNEHYCPISTVKVYGASMLEDYERKGDEPVAPPVKRKSKRKISALQVYKNMMTEIPRCGLIPRLHGNELVVIPPLRVEQPISPHKLPNPPVPTQQPVVNNRTTPLKPSIFVELSNKVKALETTLKIQIEEMEKRLSEKSETERRTEAKVDRLNLEFKSFALIVIYYYVYKLMLDLM